MRDPAASQLIWISERQAVNPSSILWVFRGLHGELEITFAGGKQMVLYEQDLSHEGRSLLLPTTDTAEEPYQAPLRFPR